MKHFMIIIYHTTTILTDTNLIYLSVDSFFYSLHGCTSVRCLHALLLYHNQSVDLISLFHAIFNLKDVFREFSSVAYMCAIQNEIKCKLRLIGLWRLNNLQIITWIENKHSYIGQEMPYMTQRRCTYKKTFVTWLKAKEAH